MSPDKGSDSIDHSVELGVNPAVTFVNESAGNKRIPVSRRSLDSFLGSNSLLDVFEAEAAAKAKKRMQPGGEPGGAAEAPPAVSVMTPEIDTPPALKMPRGLTEDQISEEFLDAIAERVVKKMSAEIVSEIAWEVVPELSEILIRRTIEESRKS